MTVHLIDVETVLPQPWRNGGGQTRELWRWPSAGPWQLRISRADIAQDGAFSAFPDVRRWFAVLHGAGVELQFGDRRHPLRPGDDALAFDGAPAPGCRLLDGPTQDLNLMASAGQATMARVDRKTPWTSHLAMRGLYTTVAGVWHGTGRHRPVPAHHLLWDDAAGAGAWQFTATDADAAGPALWLGFTAAS